MKMMKRYFIYAVAALVAGGGFVACTPEEDDLFSQSSAERLNATITDYTDLLCSAPNGWAMEYFVDNDWEPGYIYLMKFNKDTSVKMAGDNVWIGNAYVESTSVFEVITDDGPVLTFNTYNPIFHLFAAPDNVIGNGAPTDPDDPSSDLDESGYGHRGDYEFVIVKAAADLITLKGKKWGLTILMRRLAEDVDWEDYLESLKAYRNELLPSNALDMRLTVNGEAYVATKVGSGVMNFYPEGGDALTETSKVPYIITESGLRFVKPFKGKDDKGNFSIQTFRVDEERGAFVCTDAGQDAAISVYQPSYWLLDTSKSWVIDASNLGGRFADAYQAFADGVKGAKFGTLRSVGLRYTDGKHSLRWVFGTKRDEACVYDVFAMDENNVATFDFTGEGDENGLLMSDRVAEIGAFCDLLASMTYDVSYPNRLNPQHVKFTSTSVPEDWFCVTLE